uniref:CSON014967 protein n=1 Tax=Culicoides sonorensis TaxID=179676 RepID=A0A336MC37_CULSO
MNFLAKILFVALMIFGTEAAPSETKDVNCHHIPKTALNTTCCMAPEVISKSVIKQCEEDAEGQNYNEVMKECVTTACVIEKSDFMKDKEFSQELLLSHIATSLGDQPKWNDLIGSAVKICIKKGMEQHEKIIKMFAKSPFGINADECNPVPMYVANCVDAEILVNCPEKSWNDEKSCKSWRRYLSKCDIFENIPTIDLKVEEANLE